MLANMSADFTFLSLFLVVFLVVTITALGNTQGILLMVSDAIFGPEVSRYSHRA